MVLKQRKMRGICQECAEGRCHPYQTWEANIAQGGHQKSFWLSNLNVYWNYIEFAIRFRVMWFHSDMGLCFSDIRMWVSFCRTGKRCKLCLIFTVTKRFDSFKISQLLWGAFVLWSLKIIVCWSQPIFLTQQFLPILPPNCDLRPFLRTI